MSNTATTNTDPYIPNKCAGCRRPNQFSGDVDRADLRRHLDGSVEGVYQCNVCGAMTAGKPAGWIDMDDDDIDLDSSGRWYILITADDRPDHRWQALVNHADRNMNPPRGWADVTSADIWDLMAELNETADGEYDVTEYGQIGYWA